ncbi:MAG: hypothetical protein H6673_14125 [Anaerolineales bacterium]|nr:hypothetical protein [Anaerolineales bacterium]
MSDLFFLDYVVQRAIPPELMHGLNAGIYTLHGGVVRDLQGRIVRHLLPLPEVANVTASALLPSPLNAVSLVSQYQLSRQMTALGNTTQHLLEISRNTMLLSGFHLTVSAMGFAALNQKFNRLEAYLGQIEAVIRQIWEKLERQDRAKLKHALNDLLVVLPAATDRNHRIGILESARRDLGQLHIEYRALLQEATSIEEAIAFEEYFSLTGLAQVRCFAELDMGKLAYDELRNMYSTWQEQMRRLSQDTLVGDDPERFLASDFAEEAPTAVVMEWLDFTFAEDNGYQWLDKLRGRARPWYSVKLPSFSIGNRDELRRQRDQVIPALNKIITRNKVYDGYMAQYELLAAYRLTPSEFEEELAQLGHEAFTDGYLILEPINN